MRNRSCSGRSRMPAVSHTVVVYSSFWRPAALVAALLAVPAGAGRRGGERRDRVADGAAERGRLFGRALAGVRGR